MTSNPYRIEGRELNRVRSRLTRDAAWMRQARVEHVRRVRVWLEADKERIYALALQMREAGFYAATTAETCLRCSIINAIGQLDGQPQGYFGKRVWMLRTGWLTYWGADGSKAVRMRRKWRVG